jgi:hypothetical protein
VVFVDFENITQPSCYTQNPKGVVKSGVKGTGIHEFGHRKLVNSAGALDKRSVENITFSTP